VIALPLHAWSATRLRQAIAARELSALTLAEALVERSVESGHDLTAWAGFDPAAARRRARAVDRAADRAAASGGPLPGLLHGLPIAVKDNLDTAGIGTEYGSPIYAGQVPAADAACVALARAAGAWVLGKTVCTEFANMVPAATKNPHHAGHSPGGSSSGSAAAVAAGLVPLALGTQTAGSVIRPAAYCGVIGYKPSPRRIPRAGAKANSDTLDEIGLFARSVGDVVLFAAALGAVPDAGAALGVGEDRPAANSRKPTIAMTLNSRQAALSSDMAAAVADAARRLSAAGALVFDAIWPSSFDALFDAQRVVQQFETARALAPELAHRRAMLSATLAAFLDEGLRIDAADYARALQLGRQALGDVESLFGAADVIVTPAALGAAPVLALVSTGDPLMCRPWQLLGCPCISLPAALDRDRLPLGLQLVGRPGDDQRLLSVATWIARTLDSERITHACLR
jgi:Asp-tRNA(Asn)/Glu-tRNA(Gln) amidotransferase A subunit family amidase